MTLFSAILGRLGLSQAEAAVYLDVRPDTARSWAQGRRTVPDGIYAKLLELEHGIQEAVETIILPWERAGEPDFCDATALADFDWPSDRCYWAALAAVWAELPADVQIRID